MISALPYRIDLPCPHCGETDLQVIGDLVGKDQITCRICGASIDLTNEKWKSGLAEFIKGFEEIYFKR